MKVVFMGTPDFAVASLNALVEDGHELLAVVTQPDRPAGRGNKLTPPAVKVRAQELKLPVYQPQSVKDDDFYQWLRALAPEVIVVAAYGRILPKPVLDLPPWGCLNVHGSLLPAYRGAAPIQRAVLNGDSQTGVTIMQMNEGMDTGDMLAKVVLPIGEDDTSGSMFGKLAAAGAALLSQTLRRLAAGEIVPEVQDEAQATYAPMLDKAMGEIHWDNDAHAIHNQIRGLNPNPGAYTTFAGARLKIWRSQVVSAGDCAAGEVAALDNEGIVIGCGGGALKLLEVQPAGKKAMSARAFANGAGLSIGARLGN